MIAGNDFIAASIMQYVKKLGMKIPDDLAVVGADNTFIAEIVSPTLTSIDFSKEEFSQKLVDTLMALLRGEKAMDQYIPVSLCVRERRVGRQRTTTLPNTPPSYKFTGQAAGPGTSGRSRGCCLFLRLLPVL